MIPGCLIWERCAPARPAGRVLSDLGDNTSAAVQLGQPNGYDISAEALPISRKAPNWPGTPGVDSAKWQAKYSVVNRNT